jgi:hypothetical protein
MWLPRHRHASHAEYGFAASWRARIAETAVQWHEAIFAPICGFVFGSRLFRIEKGLGKGIPSARCKLVRHAIKRESVHHMPRNTERRT